MHGILDKSLVLEVMDLESNKNIQKLFLKKDIVIETQSYDKIWGKKKILQPKAILIKKSSRRKLDQVWIWKVGQGQS